jgi:tetratricopeptide (TPR) repeat protein
MVDTEEKRILRLPPSERRKALEAAAKKEPRNVAWPLALARDAAAVGDNGKVIFWSTKVLELDPANADARNLRAIALSATGAPPDSSAQGGKSTLVDPQRALARTPTPSEVVRQATAPPSPDPAKALEEGGRLVSAGKARQAEAIFSAALTSSPSSRPLRVALLEAACLAGDWGLGAEQVPRIAPIADAEPVTLFYASVVLYETGKREEARQYLERAKSRLARNSMVDEYTTKILGKS